MTMVFRIIRQLAEWYSGSAPPGSISKSCCLALLALGMTGTTVANAQITGNPQVIGGQANFSQNGNVLSITNSPNTVINWQSFSVDRGAVTQFIQQNGSSAVLNRIVGQDPSRILGALQSNGQVYLINPNGILFGANATVDVKGLVASTHNIATDDFMAGRMNFAGGNRGASIVNQGSITTPQGGQVILIADNVINSGLIAAPRGNVVLAAGQSVRIAEPTNPSLQVVVSAPADAAINLGQIIANAGNVGIYGSLIEQHGIVNANTAVIGENGQILLRASSNVVHFAGSQTTTNGAGTGTITVESGGDVSVLAGATLGASQLVRLDAAGVVTLATGSQLSPNTEIVSRGNFVSVKPRIQTAVPAASQCLQDPTIVGCDQILTPQVCLEATLTTTINYCAALYQPSVNIQTCIANPRTPGCSAILPTIDTCTMNPSTSGCIVVLPTMTVCSTTPSEPGCSAVLPSLSVCIAMPSTPGCTAVLPSTTQCLNSPSMAGCKPTQITVNSCLSNPMDSSCLPLSPSASGQSTNPVNQALANMNSIISTSNTMVDVPLFTNKSFSSMSNTSTNTSVNISQKMYCN